MDTINCRRNHQRGHNFYLEHDGKEYYLFSQDYHRGVNIYFSRGVSLEDALDPKKARRDHCVIKTMSKMRPYIRYIEKEFNLQVLDNTKRKSLPRRKSAHQERRAYEWAYEDCCEC